MAEDGPILVIAGAGSGKTRTLTYRVARLIEKGIGPERILLATFTNKAAREMLSRVEKLTGVDVSRLWGGTFHHIGNMILRREGPRIGLQRNFAILDEEDADQVINTCMAEMKIDSKADGFPKGRIVRDIISYASNTGQALDKVVTFKYPELLNHIEQITELSRYYLKRKRENNALDFDDLLLCWLDLLKNSPEVRDFYSEKFRHILVDEYQDTNVVQAELIDILAGRHRCIMAVGDDAQSIYSFRGADFEHILRFPDRYPDVKIYKLETNYRSTPEILNLANRSIRNNDLQFQKELRSVRNPGTSPVLAPVRNVNSQAEFVAQRIIELAGEGIALGEIAVLYRAHYHSMELQMELTRRGIPFEIRSGIRFFEQAHIKDVGAYMRIIANPQDETAWKRIFGLYPGVGKLTAEKLCRFVRDQGNPLRGIEEPGFLKCASKKARPGLEKFVELACELKSPDYRDRPAAMIGCVLDNGYRNYLQLSYTDYLSREDDLNRLAVFAARFRDLNEFLSELALFSNMAENEQPRGPDEKRIVLTTVHQAKGLEWSVVFIIWCAEGMIPLARALKEEGGLEEERRLFYVASTRAKDLLYFCYPLVDYGRGPGATVVSPSRFIQELKPLPGERSGYPYEKWTVEDY